MADINVGTHNRAREDLPTPNDIPGAFPGDMEAASNAMSAEIVVPKTQNYTIASGGHVGGGERLQHQQERHLAGSKSAVPRAQQDSVFDAAAESHKRSGHTSHPTGGIQPSLKQADEQRLASAAEEQVLEQVACPIEARPPHKQEQVRQALDKPQGAGTVTAGELAQGITTGVASTAAAVAQAAHDAALWAKEKAVENYPAARDATVNTASAAGETTQSAIQSAAASLPESVKNPLGATMSQNSREEQAAAAVPEPVRASIAKAGRSPEAAANPEAVQDKQLLESQLLAIAKEAGVGAGAEDRALQGNDNARREPAATHNRAAVRNSSAAVHNTSAAVGNQRKEHPHMPARAESTNYVKILGTETIRHQIHPTSSNNTYNSIAEPRGQGIAAMRQSTAHGGGPAEGAPTNRGVMAGSTGHLDSTEPHPDMATSLQAKQRQEVSPSVGEVKSTSIGSPVEAASSGHGLSTFSHRPTETAQSISGPGAADSTPRASDNFSAQRGAAPVQRQYQPVSDGQNLHGSHSSYNHLESGTDSGIADTGNGHGQRGDQHADLEYNKLSSGTVSGVAEPHVARQ